jgi:hypothetical protein
MVLPLRRRTSYIVYVSLIIVYLIDGIKQLLIVMTTHLLLKRQCNKFTFTTRNTKIANKVFDLLKKRML